MIKEVGKVTISKENAWRILDILFFKAQLYANIYRFGHLDPKNPPKIKGVEFEIKLAEETQSIVSKLRRMSILERICLAGRLALMLNNQMIRPSRLHWSSPVNLMERGADGTVYLTHALQANSWQR